MVFIRIDPLRASIIKLCVAAGRLWCVAVVMLVPLAMLGMGRVCAEAPDGGEGYSFAVSPQFEQRKLFAIWKPIVDELEKRTGLRLRLITTLTVSEFERELTAGRLDFVYNNPYQIMREGPRQGYIPLVRDEAPLRGILVVAKDGPIRSLADLDGKLLAVPSPNAFGASLLLRADLERLHRIKMRLSTAKTHSSVYLHVTQGLADAGGGVNKTLQEQPEAIRESLRVLYTTNGVPSHPISAHPRVPAEARGKVQAALLAMGATAEGRALLAKVPMSHVIPTSMQDYLPMIELGLEALWVEGAQ